MARKNREDQDDEEIDYREAGTQQPLDSLKASQGAKDAEKPKEEADLSEQEAKLRRNREENQRQREQASEEYGKKIEEAKEKERQERESKGKEEQPVPEECGQFEGYGYFYVPKDMNIRGKDQSRGSVVALNWDEYQALRNVEVYPEPVPKPPEQQEGDKSNPTSGL